MQRKTEDTRSPSRLQRVLGFISIATMLMIGGAVVYA